MCVGYSILSLSLCVCVCVYRLFRLVTKLGFINERPEFKNNPAWSETENRYLLKLFRDYVFHQINGDG
jgi:PAB-dependent poly(A)-specific ribonuclease subunit 3